MLAAVAIVITRYCFELVKGIPRDLALRLRRKESLQPLTETGSGDSPEKVFVSTATTCLLWIL